MPSTDQLTAQLDRLATTDTGPYPVVSLYLNLQADDRARRPQTASERTPAEQLADALIVKAHQTSASVRFIEDPRLLEAVGGVGAFLRFRV